MPYLRWMLLGVTLTALAAGGVAWLSGAPTVADACWIAGTVAAILPATWWVIAALRERRFGVDVLAVLSLGGALAVGEYLAGALIGVMLATGQALDAAAERRATKDLRALLDRVPRTARRRSGDVVEVVDLDAIALVDEQRNLHHCAGFEGRGLHDVRHGVALDAGLRRGDGELNGRGQLERRGLVVDAEQLHRIALLDVHLGAITRGLGGGLRGASCGGRPRQAAMAGRMVSVHSSCSLGLRC